MDHTSLPLDVFEIIEWVLDAVNFTLLRVWILWSYFKVLRFVLVGSLVHFDSIKSHF